MAATDDSDDTTKWNREMRAMKNRGRRYEDCVTLTKQGTIYLPVRVYEQYFADSDYVAMFTDPDGDRVAIKPVEQDYGGSIWKIADGGAPNAGSISFIGVMHRHFGEVDYSQVAPIHEEGDLIVIDLNDIEFVEYDPVPA